MAVNLDNYDSVFFDCDGVIWTGKQAIPGSIQTLLTLQSHHKHLFFVTNNSIQTQHQLAARLCSFGYPCAPEQVYCPGSCLLPYLRFNYPSVRKLFLIGESHLRSALENAGLEVIHSTDFTRNARSVEEVVSMGVEEGVGAVVVGLQYGFNFHIACYASICVQKGAVLLAANADEYALASGGVRTPGAYSLVRFIEQSTDRKAEVIGKPSPFFFHFAETRNVLDPKRCLMVGDTVETDVGFANACGIDCALVLSGVTKEREVESGNLKAKFVIDRAAELIRTLD